MSKFSLANALHIFGLFIWVISAFDIRASSLRVPQFLKSEAFPG